MSSDQPPPRSTEGLLAYLRENRGRFTDEALERSALDAGHTPAEFAAAKARLDSETAAAPVRARARTILVAAYLGTFLVLVAGMFLNPSARAYGGSVIGSVILAVTLGVAWLITIVWLRSQSRPSPSGAGLTVLLSLPIVLLVLVAGSCLATGMPIPTTSYP